MLHILHEHCRRHGVELHFTTRPPDASRFENCDVIVGADGVNSVVRQQYETFHEKMDLDPLPLTYSYMTRGGRLDANTAATTQSP